MKTYIKVALFVSTALWGLPALAQPAGGGPGPQPLPGISLPVSVANGGTGVTTSTGTGSNVLSTSPSLTTPSLGDATATAITTGQIFNILHYGASPGASAAANTTAIQAAITAAQAVNGVVYIPSAGATGCYNTTGGGLTISNNVALIGDAEMDAWGGGADVPLGSPPLRGSVLCPTSNASAGLLIAGTSLTVNIENIGISFGTSFSGTGDGISYIPSSTNQGLSGSHWKHVRVYGVDGNHYSYNLQNPIFDVFDDVYSYGGGCLKLYGNSTTTNYGNSVFNMFYGKDMVGGTANCVTISASAAQRLNDITFIQGTAVTALISTVNPGNPPTSAQYIWNMDTNVQAISGFGMDLETNVNSKVLLGAPAKMNNMDWGSMFTDAAALEAPAWTTNGVMVGPLTQTFTDTTSSGTVAIQATNVLPSVTLKASSATTYTKAPTLYLGAPVASTNVTITSPQSLYATGEIYTASDLTTAAGLFDTGTTQINTNAGTNTTAIGNGTTSGTVTIGGASNTTNLSSATVALSGNETVAGTLNKLTLTTPATAATLTLANNKTVTINNTLTLAGTDSTTMTFPAASDTVAALGTAQIFTKPQTITDATANNGAGLTVNPSTLTSGTSGFGVNVQGTLNTASNVVGAVLNANITNTACGSCTLISLQAGVGGTTNALSLTPAGTLTAGFSINAGTSGTIGWTSGGGLTSPATNSVTIGPAPAASQSAQTIGTANIVAGTSNTAGVNLTIAAGKGTGTGAGGSLIFGTAPAGSTGTSSNALATAMTIDSTGLTTLTPQAGAYSLTLSPPSQTSGTTGSGINIAQTINDASNVDGTTWFSNTTCTSCTNSTNIFDWQVGGSSIFKSDKFGDVTAAGGFTMGSTNQFIFGARVILTSPAAANLKLGAADASSPIAQTLSTQGSRGGTDTNVAGANLTIQSGLGTGNATGSSIIFQTPAVGSTGTTAETATTALTLDGTQKATFAGLIVRKAYVVSTLPASPGTGAMAYVTDAVACTFLATLTGGGSTYCPVGYNGTAWVGE